MKEESASKSRRALHDYSNVYICGRNPMMYVRRDRHNELVVLRVGCDVLDLDGAIVADGNASSNYTRFHNAPDGLANIDAAITFAGDPRHPNMYERWERTRRQCAEVLVPDCIPARYIWCLRFLRAIPRSLCGAWAAVAHRGRSQDVLSGMTDSGHNVDVVVGDLFEAPAQTLVNTVNRVGVMGKGVALLFKQRFPAMYKDYLERCGRGEVELGRPYLYRNPAPPHVLNFPTKGHWRYLQRTLSSKGSSDDVPRQRHLDPGWVALVAALSELLSDPHHWPIGRTSFQKLAYFLTAAGVPTGLEFVRGTYGPYAADLTRVISALVNNDLLTESQLGRRMIEIEVGDTFPAARVAYEDLLDAWREPIRRAAGLLARMRTREAEVAATVHLVASEAGAGAGGPPTDEAILAEVMEWKRRKLPPLREDEVLNAIHSLAMLGWVEVAPSGRMHIDEAALVGF
jgi:hypothetical protein